MKEHQKNPPDTASSSETSPESSGILQVLEIVVSHGPEPMPYASTEPGMKTSDAKWADTNENTEIEPPLFHETRRSSSPSPRPNPNAVHFSPAESRLSCLETELASLKAAMHLSKRTSQQNADCDSVTRARLSRILSSTTAAGAAI